jgi:hypothetical protein
MESNAAVMMTWSKAGVIAEALGSIGIVCTLFCHETTCPVQRSRSSQLVVLSSWL